LGRLVDIGAIRPRIHVADTPSVDPVVVIAGREVAEIDKVTWGADIANLGS